MVLAMALILGSYALQDAFPAPAASASPVKQEQALPFEDCSALNTQRETDECFVRQSKHSQQQLDSLLRELRPALQPQQQSLLLSSQATWLKYRDLHCKWQAAFFEGGSIQPTEYMTCVTELNWRRVDELKVDLCEGHGMTGECPASHQYDRPVPQVQKP